MTVLGPLEEKAAMIGEGFTPKSVSGGSIYPSGVLHDDIIAIKDVDGTILCGVCLKERKRAKSYSVEFM